MDYVVVEAIMSLPFPSWLLDLEKTKFQPNARRIRKKYWEKNSGLTNETEGVSKFLVMEYLPPKK